MKRIDECELKKIQIDILDNFDAFCKKNGINYWLDYGTLLGAVRHKGYIPWDDDIDIGMLREDYKKAEILFNKQSGGEFKMSTPANDSMCSYPFGKLIQTNTVLFEYGNEGIKTGVYVDVFPYDTAPADEKKVRKAFRKRDFLGRLRRLQLPMRQGIPLPKKVLYYIGAGIMGLLPSNVINQAIDNNARRYEMCNSNNVCSFTDTYETKHLIVDKNIFESLTVVEFEDKRYPAPADYDYWLTSLYGNYMELPPEEQRAGHHVFEAYYVD